MKYKTIDFESIDSTNLYIKQNYQHLDNFTFVSSLFQSKGKGRNVITWDLWVCQEIILVLQDLLKP